MELTCVHLKEREPWGGTGTLRMNQPKDDSTSPEERPVLSFQDCRVRSHGQGQAQSGVESVSGARLPGRCTAGGAGQRPPREGGAHSHVAFGRGRDTDGEKRQKTELAPAMCKGVRGEIAGSERRRRLTPAERRVCADGAVEGTRKAAGASHGGRTSLTNSWSPSCRRLLHQDSETRSSGITSGFRQSPGSDVSPVPSARKWRLSGRGPEL